MKDFEEALTSQGKHPSIPEEDNWFGPLVGTWDMEWIDGHGTEQERHVPGEWIFSWVLEGTAIQDIFICPSRQARKTKTWPDAAYGTTIRIYHPGKRAWDIVLTEITQKNMKWIFSDITDHTFHWKNIHTPDGKNWLVGGEAFATRRQ